MGARYGGVCWSSQAEALDAYYADVAPAQAVGLTTTLNTFTYSGGAWKMSQYVISSSGVWSLKYSTNAPVKSFAACTDPDDPSTQFLDGLSLGWGVVLAMAIAWGFREMKRQVK